MYYHQLTRKASLSSYQSTNALLQVLNKVIMHNFNYLSSYQSTNASLQVLSKVITYNFNYISS